jgi:hypothetical protein
MAFSLQSNPTVALIDWSWKGHHPTYFCLFAQTLLELGCKVRALCPSPDEVRSRLSGLPEEHRARLSCEFLPEWAQAPRGTPLRWKPLVAAVRSFLSLRGKLARGTPLPDFLFFACIYDWEFFHYPVVHGLVPRRWGGLYLQSFGFRKTTSPLYSWHRKWSRPERFARSPGLVALATLDEGIENDVNAMAGPGKCVVFPDIADCSAPEEGENTLAGQLRARAGGRPIIMLCGMLYPQRGVDVFLRTALANPQWCFALVGEIPFFANESAGKALLDEFSQRHPHGFVHLSKVPEGAVYNSMVAASDVIWNIHVDWPGSSNTLTKAALFEKPVLVGDGHLLAERVRKFRLGEVCQENSTASISQALHAVLDAREAWAAARRPMWKEYREEHSPECLRAAFEKILAQV